MKLNPLPNIELARAFKIEAYNQIAKKYNHKLVHQKWSEFNDSISSNFWEVKVTILLELGYSYRL